MRRSLKTRLLEVAKVYSKIQDAIISPNFHKVLISEYIRPFPNCTVLDVGCGPAAILKHLPEVKYFGLDHNPKYISAASKKYGSKGTFICAEVDQLSDYGLKTFDRVLLLGVIHHLEDDQVSALMVSLKELLNPGGILFTFDPMIEDSQHPVAKLLVQNDRGNFVRTRTDYLSLIGYHFSLETADTRHDLLRVPYTHLLTRSTAQDS